MTDDLFCVLATGPSMSQAIADQVRGKCRVLAVSNAYALAPWAEALVSHDRAWWRAHPDAFDFAGEKYCKFELHGTKTFCPLEMPMGCNSGLMAMYVARHLGAKKILLCGFDMHGSHYFGPHDESRGLKITTEKRFRQHINQFHAFSGPEVVNCTPGSALDVYQMAALSAMLPV